MEKNILISSIPRDKLINIIIDKSLKIIKDFNLSKMLSINKYEKMIPFNLWFKNPLYEIKDFYQNNQHLRLRYYKSILLTPLITFDNKLSIRNLIPDLTLYQAFYPDSFYSYYELIKNINNKVLNISYEHKLGDIEAIIFYNERYNKDYINNIYHTIVINDLSIDYLSQVYKLKIIKKPCIKYDFINIDIIDVFDDIFLWKNQEHDLQATIFYLLNSLSYLKKGGSMMIKLNMIGTKQWTIIFEITEKIFEGYKFKRSKILNPYNGEIHLYLEKYKGGNIKTTYNNFLKNIYKCKTYEILKLNVNYDSDITEEYKKQIKRWINNIINIDKIKGNIEEWHKKHNLYQIKDLKLEKNNNDPLEIIINDEKGMIGKEINKVELNYYKRVMDTKPNTLFANKYNKNNLLMTWEELTNLTNNNYKELKYIIKKKYNGEIITNAWIKMYEMLTLHDLIPEKNKIKTFHICEAPGAFISALNHYLELTNQELEWYAQTIEENDKTLGDRYGLISKYPNKWFIGDISEIEIIKSYVNNPLLKDIDFMTADAGIYSLPNEINEQEINLLKINLGQITCILSCLNINGSAIVKTFLPMSEPITISIIYLLSKVFKEIKITKPSGSHASNSEIYIILKEFKGIENKILEKLYELMKNFKNEMLFKIEEIFMENYNNTINIFIERQIKSLKMNYYYYYHLDELKIEKNNWFEKYPIVWLKNKIN